MKGLENKDLRGGPRPGSGRPSSGVETGTITFRAEKDDLDRARQVHGKELNDLFRKWLKRVARGL